MINEPGKSRVEDNINIYLSSGTAAIPILIHDNYIQGAYTINPAQGSYSNKTYSYDWSYAGGGILLGDGGTTTLSQATGHSASLRQHRCFHSELRNRDRGRS